MNCLSACPLDCGAMGTTNQPGMVLAPTSNCDNFFSKASSNFSKSSLLEGFAVSRDNSCPASGVCVCVCERERDARGWWWVCDVVYPWGQYSPPNNSLATWRSASLWICWRRSFSDSCSSGVFSSTSWAVFWASSSARRLALCSAILSSFGFLACLAAWKEAGE